MFDRYGVPKIHACPSYCIFYRKKFKKLTKCPRFRVSRYKVKDDNDDEHNLKNGPPAKVLDQFSRKTLLSLSYHCLGACFKPYKAFFNLKTWLE